MVNNADEFLSEIEKNGLDIAPAKKYLETEEGEIIDQTERKKIAEMTMAKALLGDLNTDDYSFENWDRLKDGYLRGSISFDTWKEYWADGSKRHANGNDKKQMLKDVGDEEDVTQQQTTIFRQLARDFYERQPYFFDSAKLWWLWNKKEYFWEVKDEVDIMNRFDKYFNQESEKSNIKSSIIEALRKYGRLQQPKEIKPTWIQFKKQIYDIETDKTFEPTPKYFSSNPIPWEMGTSEDTPNIDRLFKTWVKEEDVVKLYELFAFTLVPQMFIHSFHFLYSAPGMGKSTYVNLLIKFIGGKNVVSTSISRINSNPRFETLNWHKKLLITMSEVSNVNELQNSGLINQATGEDQVRAEIKGGGGFDFFNYGKFIYPTNKLLKVNATDGFGRRVRTIKFQTRFEKEKDILITIPDIEFNNLAKKCTRIAKELYITRKFNGDVDISKRMQNYQEESKTTLEKFIDNYCDISNFEDKLLLDEFIAKFNIYLKEKGERTTTKPVLSKDLRKLGWEMKRETVKSSQKTFDSYPKYDKKTYILGLTLDRQDRETPKSHLEPHEESNTDIPVLPVLPVRELNKATKSDKK